MLTKPRSINNRVAVSVEPAKAALPFPAPEDALEDEELEVLEDEELELLEELELEELVLDELEFDELELDELELVGEGARSSTVRLTFPEDKRDSPP
jgi:hypothetical protein